MDYTTEHTIINRYGREEAILTHISFHSFEGREYARVEHEVKGQGVRYGLSHDYSTKRIAELKARAPQMAVAA